MNGPSAPDAEQAVLSILLSFPAAWPEAADILRPELFHNPGHREVYEAAWDLWTRGNPVDPITVCDALRHRGTLQEVGGPVLIARIASAVNGSHNLNYLCRILVEQHVGRALLSIGQGAMHGATSGVDALDLLDRVSAQVTDIYAYTQGARSVTAADGLDALTDGEPPRHLRYGISELDYRAVLEPGLPHVFAGRPGIGKSIFSCEVMWHLTLTGSVLIFSPEMTVKQVQARIVARECGVPYSTIIRRQMNVDQVDIVARKALELSERMGRLIIDDTAGITPDQMRARTERAIKTRGVVAFGVDHLHEMRSGHAQTDRKEYDRVSVCMDGITKLAKNTGLPALVMCQLSRQVEGRGDKRPTLSDLRGSGEIEQKAAVVGLLYREGYYQADPPWDDTLEINVAKNRDGAVGVCRAHITPALSRIGPTLATPKEDVPLAPF